MTVESGAVPNDFLVFGNSAFGVFQSITSLEFTFQASGQAIYLVEGTLPFTSSLTSPISINGGQQFFNSIVDNTSGGNTFDLSGFSGALGSLASNGTLSNTIILNTGSSVALSDSGLTRGSSSLAMSGVGTALLTMTGGNNTLDVTGWSGNLHLANNAGNTLRFSNPIELTNAANNGTLVFNDTPTSTVSTVTNLSGSGNLQVLNAGTLIFDGGSATGTAGVSDFYNIPNGGDGGSAITLENGGTLTLGAGTSLGGGKGGDGVAQGGAGGHGVLFNGAGTMATVAGTTISGGDGGLAAENDDDPPFIKGIGGEAGSGIVFNGTGNLSTTTGTVITGGAGGGGYFSAAGGTGVLFNAGGTFTNGSGASIVGGRGADGTQTGSGGTGVIINGGGTLVNEAGASISGGAGVWIDTPSPPIGLSVAFNGSKGNLTNAGTLNGSVFMDYFANTVTLFTGSIINGDLNMNGDGGATLILDGIGNQTYSSVVTGQTYINGSMVKNGNGAWTLDRDLQALGDIFINAGALIATTSSSFGTGTVTINSSAVPFSLGYLDAITLQNQLILTADIGLHVGDNAAAVQQGAISESEGSRGLTKVGSGMLTLSGANAYSGDTILEDGVLIAGHTSAFGTGTVTIRSSAVPFSLGYLDGVTLSNELILATDTVLHVGESAVAIHQGVISEFGGSRGLTKVGSGMLTLSGANAYAGGTTLAAGTLVVTNSASLGSGVISFSGGTLKYGAGFTFDFSSRFSTAPGQEFAIDTNGGNVTFATALTSSGGSLTKLGDGELALLGANSFEAGIVVLMGDLRLGAGSSVSGVDGGFSENGDGGQGGEAIQFHSAGILTNNAGASIAGGEGGGSENGDGGQGGDGVTFDASGRLINSAGASVTGGSGGSSENRNGGQGGNGVTFNGGGTLINSLGASITGGHGGSSVNGIGGVSGFGVLFQGGVGTLTNAGTINGGVSMGSFANNVTLFSGSVINGDLNMNTDGGTTLTLDGDGTQTYSSAVTGTTTFSGSLVKQGAGAWTLDKALAAPGGATVNGGYLYVAETLGGQVVVAAGGALGGTGFINGDVTIQDQGTLRPGDPSRFTVNGSVTLNSGATSSFFIGTPALQNSVTPGSDYSQVAIRDSASPSQLTIQTGVILEIVNLSSLVLNTVAYDPAGPNSELFNYFVFSLQTGSTSGRFDFLSDGTSTQAITYSNGIGVVVLGGTEIFLTYTGNGSANSTTGGQDVVLTAYAVPEPSVYLLVLIGIALSFLRARKHGVRKHCG